MDLPPNNDEKRKPKGGRWKKGQSGNPAGRPPGARNQATLAREALLEDAGDSLVNKAIALALSRRGSLGALKLCLERLMPVRRGRVIQLPVQDLNGSEALAGAVHEALKAACRGELTPEEAESIARVVLMHNQLIETADHEKRLAAIEASLEANPKDKAR
jgi:hypothetical protein